MSGLEQFIGDDGGDGAAPPWSQAAPVIGPYPERVGGEPGRKRALAQPADGGEGARSLRRELFGLAPDTPAEVRIAGFRAALEMLRPVLSRIWLDTTPASGSWPVEVRGHADGLAELIAAQPPQAARRPGTGPDTVSLDPADDASFTLAHQLGPFAATVEAMSKDGKLVCHVAGGDGRLRLTSTEHTELSQQLITMVPGSQLVRLPKPRRPRRPEADLPWTATFPALPALIVGVTAIGRGLDGLHHSGWDIHTGAAVLYLTVGLATLAFGAASLARAGRRLLARSVAVRRWTAMRGDGAPAGSPGGVLPPGDSGSGG